MLFFERYNRLRLQQFQIWNFQHCDYWVDRRGYKIVYTDGSAFGNHRRGQRFSGSATFWAPRNWTSSASQSPFPEENTNQRAEIRAVLHALRHAADCWFPNIQVRTDSRYVVDSLNHYIFNWRVNGWENREGNPVAHCKIFQEINILFDSFDGCEIVYVRRDSDPGIRAADGYAKEAAEHHREVVQRNEECGY